MNSNWLEYLDVDCLNSDLFLAPVEAIVCNVNTQLALNYNLGRRLATLGGISLVQAIQKTALNLPGNRLILGQALIVDIPEPWGSFEKVILTAWWDFDNDYSERLIYSCIISSLREAFDAQIRSLAMPLIGMGSGQIKIQDFARIFVSVLRDLNALRTNKIFPLENRLLFSLENKLILQVQEYLEKHLYR